MNKFEKLVAIAKDHLFEARVENVVEDTAVFYITVPDEGEICLSGTLEDIAWGLCELDSDGVDAICEILSDDPDLYDETIAPVTVAIAEFTDIAEAGGWSVSKSVLSDSYEVEISKWCSHSDYEFTTTLTVRRKSDILDEVEGCYKCFDRDEWVHLWLDSSLNSDTKGIPAGDVLMATSFEIERMLENLNGALVNYYATNDLDRSVEGLNTITNMSDRFITNLSLMSSNVAVCDNADPNLSGFSLNLGSDNKLSQFLRVEQTHDGKITLYVWANPYDGDTNYDHKIEINH